MKAILPLLPFSWDPLLTWPTFKQPVVDFSLVDMGYIPIRLSNEVRYECKQRNEKENEQVLKKNLGITQRSFECTLTA